MVMDQRIVATSTVRCVGPVLLLQGRRYAPPYTITAIGDTRAMEDALDDSEAVTELPPVRRLHRPGIPGRPRATASRCPRTTAPSTSRGNRIMIVAPDPRGRQLRQLRLQPGAVPRPARGRVRRAPQRRDRRRATASGTTACCSHRARARPSGPASASSWCAAAPAGSRCSACAWGCRRSGSRTAPPSAGRRSCCTARPARSTTTASACWPACPNPFTATRYHSLAIEPSTVPDVLAGHRRDGRRRAHGATAPRRRRRRRAVPPRVGSHRGRSPDARQLADGVRRRRAPSPARPAWHRWCRQPPPTTCGGIDTSASVRSGVLPAIKSRGRAGTGRGQPLQPSSCATRITTLAPGFTSVPPSGFCAKTTPGSSSQFCSGCAMTVNPCCRSVASALPCG